VMGCEQGGGGSGGKTGKNETGNKYSFNKAGTAAQPSAKTGSDLKEKQTPKKPTTKEALGKTSCKKGLGSRAQVGKGLSLFLRKSVLVEPEERPKHLNGPRQTYKVCKTSRNGRGLELYTRKKRNNQEEYGPRRPGGGGFNQWKGGEQTLSFPDTKKV